MHNLIHHNKPKQTTRATEYLSPLTSLNQETWSTDSTDSKPMQNKLIENIVKPS